MAANTTPGNSHDAASDNVAAYDVTEVVDVVIDAGDAGDLANDGKDGKSSVDDVNVDGVNIDDAARDEPVVANAQPDVPAIYQLVMIGGGNMGSALIGGALTAGTIAASELAIVEKIESRRAELTKQFPGVTVVDEVPACRSCVVAVKPDDVPDAVAAAAAAGATRLLSVAAGVTIAAIEAAAGATDVVVLRAMPNTPALVGGGVTALAASKAATHTDLVWAQELLAGVGLVVDVKEAQLDAVTGLTGSGPAYVFLVAEALIDAGVNVGLSRAQSEAMVAQLLVGSSRLLHERGDAAGLRAMVTSPGGTTAAGLLALEQRGVRAAFIDAVRAATARSVELGMPSPTNTI